MPQPQKFEVYLTWNDYPILMHKLPKIHVSVHFRYHSNDSRKDSLQIYENVYYYVMFE